MIRLTFHLALIRPLHVFTITIIHAVVLLVLHVHLRGFINLSDLRGQIQRPTALSWRMAKLQLLAL